MIEADQMQAVTDNLECFWTFIDHVVVLSQGNRTCVFVKKTKSFHEFSIYYQEGWIVLVMWCWCPVSSLATRRCYVSRQDKLSMHSHMITISADCILRLWVAFHDMVSLKNIQSMFCKSMNCNTLLWRWNMLWNCNFDLYIKLYIINLYRIQGLCS